MTEAQHHHRTKLHPLPYSLLFFVHFFPQNHSSPTQTQFNYSCKLRLCIILSPHSVVLFWGTQAIVKILSVLINGHLFNIKTSCTWLLQIYTQTTSQL